MWSLVLMITTEYGSENQAQASTVLGRHTRSCLRSDTSLSLACEVEIKSYALSLIGADHASLAACQVACHLSWRIVLCDGNFHSSTCHVCDYPHKLITPAKSAASCARLLARRAVANSSWQDSNWMCTWLSILQAIKCTCSCRTAYTRSANYWKHIDEQASGCFKGSFRMDNTSSARGWNILRVALLLVRSFMCVLARLYATSKVSRM